jgi:hypothetical protein
MKNNKQCFYARVRAIMPTEPERYELVGKIYAKMKKKGLTKAWSPGEMTDEEFGVAYSFTNLLRENGKYTLPNL